MAKSVEQWQQLIIDQLASNNIAVSGSRTSLRRIWTYVFAFCAWSVDVLFDLHRDEVARTIQELKPHTLRWYRNKALEFRYGYPLITDSDQYDDTGLSEEQIAESKIIKYSAVVEASAESRLILKIATEVDGRLHPINVQQRNSFQEYINEIKDAGVSVSIINYLPDRLYLTMQIYFDPLVLDAQGNSIVSGGRPVEDALEAYLRDLPFNGELVLAHLVDKLQAVPGVDIPHMISAQTSWVDGVTEDYGPIEPINVKRIPESGYFVILDYNGIQYLPNVNTSI